MYLYKKTFYLCEMPGSQTCMFRNYIYRNNKHKELINMNCFYHPDRPAVTTCTDCGKGLCSECASHSTPILCPECFDKRKEGNIRKDIRSLVIYVLLFIAGYSLAPDDPGKSSEYNPFMIGYALVSIVTGWQFLTRYQPLFLQYASIVIWFFYFLVKILLSVWAGAILSPFIIIRKIYRIVKYWKMQY